MKIREKDEKLEPYNLNFINGTFRDVLIPQKDITNKQILLVKDIIEKVLPKASEEYLGVNFLYTEEDKEIIPFDDETIKYRLEKNKIYRCIEKPKEKDTRYITLTGYKDFTFCTKSQANLEYSLDGETWNEYTKYSTSTIITTITTTNKVLYLRGTDNTTLSTKSTECFTFGGDGENFITCTGDFRTLFNYKDVDNVDLSTANCMNSLFYNCKYLAYIDLSSISSITGDSGCYEMFYNCIALEQVNLSGLKTLKGKTTCKNMFSNCSALTSVDLSNLEEIKGTSVCMTMFYKCTSLTTINLGSLKSVSTTSGGKYEGYNFYQCFMKCTSLNAINLRSLTSYEGNMNSMYMFDGCTSLKIANSGTDSQLFITIPVDTADTSIDSMFSGTGGTYTSNPIAGSSYYIYSGSIPTEITTIDTTKKSTNTNIVGNTETTATDEPYTWVKVHLGVNSVNIKEVNTFENEKGSIHTLYILNRQYDDYKVGIYIYDEESKEFKIKATILDNKLNQDVIETIYSTSTSYSIGSYCVYNGDLYKCKTATSGEFDTNAWENITLKKYITDLIIPVGSMYTQYKGMADPNTLYENTTWDVYTEIADNNTLYSNSTKDLNTDITENIYIINHTLTTDEILHTHTYQKSNTATESHILTKDEIASHNHTIYLYSYYGRGATYNQVGWSCGDTDRGAGTGTWSNTGGGQGHTHDITLTETESGEIGGSQGHTHPVEKNLKLKGFTIKLWQRVA